MPSLNFLNDKKMLYFAATAVLVVYFAPLFIQGRDAAIIAYDLLDSSHVWYKVLAHSKMIFADSYAVVPNMMDGLPRLSYPSEFDFILWLYYFLDDFTAYVVNNILIHTTAFVGMILLLRRYVVPNETPYANVVVVSVALLFAITPFWSPGGLSVAGQPLLIWALLNIRNGSAGKTEWAVVVLMPFYSSFVLAMFFFLGVAVLFVIYDYVRNRRFDGRFVFAIVLMIVLYLVRDYRLVEGMLFPTDFVSHRVEFHIHTKDFLDGFVLTRVNFLVGHPNNSPLNYYFILPTVLLAMVLGLFEKKTREFVVLIVVVFLLIYALGLWPTLLTMKYLIPAMASVALWGWFKAPKENRRFYGLVLLLLLIEFVYGQMFNQVIESIGEKIAFFKTFNLSRINFLVTVIWYILFASAFSIMLNISVRFLAIVVLLIAGQTAMAFHYAEFQASHKGSATFRQFYSPETFEKVARYIGLPQQSYRVASLGIVPTVAVYNGFYTIDGYSVNYPLAYKKKFRKIIAASLKEHLANRQMYDRWGSKVYLFAPRLSYFAFDRSGFEATDPQHTFDFNTTALRNLGTRYVLSRVEVDNADRLHWKFLERFETVGELYTVYLYDIDENVSETGAN